MSENQVAHILLIDDDQSIHDLVGLMLKRAGYRVSYGFDAKEGAAILKQQPLPDLLILDLMLPGVSGIEFLKQLRGKTVFDEMPVIILSALADPDQIGEGLDAGADRYLTKPYLANNLLRTVQDILKTGRRKPNLNPKDTA